jgi:hypothetical protein
LVLFVHSLLVITLPCRCCAAASRPHIALPDTCGDLLSNRLVELLFGPKVEW